MGAPGAEHTSEESDGENGPIKLVLERANGHRRGRIIVLTEEELHPSVLGADCSQSTTVSGTAASCLVVVAAAVYEVEHINPQCNTSQVRQLGKEINLLLAEALVTNVFPVDVHTAVTS